MFYNPFAIFAYIAEGIVDCVHENEELRRKEFVKKERKINPSVPILMVYGTLKEDCVYPLIEKTYTELSKIFDNLYIVKLPGDNDGIDFHCHVSHHKKMAEVLMKKITSIIR